MKRFMLVYQEGIANVFEVDCFNLSDFGRNAKRLMQGDFKQCENFAKGLAYGGNRVHVAHCNQAGDIANSTWSADLDNAPFCDKFALVRCVDCDTAVLEWGA